MRKNILIGILTVCFMTSLSYGVIQQSEAENQRKRADEMEALAKQNEALAKEMHERAAMQLKIAEERAHQANVIAQKLIEKEQQAEKQRKK